MKKRLDIFVLCLLLIAPSFLWAADKTDAVLKIEKLAQLPKKLKENSGIAYFKQTLWFINDSGNAHKIYQVDPVSLKIDRAIKISQAENKDWETLAHDHQHLFVGDCGNNSGKRNNLTLYKIKWRDILKNDKAPANSIQFSYADKKKRDKGKNHNFDCEAMTSVDDNIWLFTKNRGDKKTNLYIIDKSSAQQTLKKAGTFSVNGLITGADYNPSTQKMALIGYKKSAPKGRGFVWIIPVGQDTLLWKKARYYRLNQPGQWEAIGWRDNQSLYISTEKNPLIRQSLGLIQVK